MTGRELAMGTGEHSRRRLAQLAARWSYLIKRVAAPMLLATALCLGISLVTHSAWLQSLLIGLAGTWIGVLVTVFYVEVILERQAEQRWAAPTSLMTQR